MRNAWKNQCFKMYFYFSIYSNKICRVSQSKSRWWQPVTLYRTILTFDWLRIPYIFLVCLLHIGFKLIILWKIYVWHRLGVHMSQFNDMSIRASYYGYQAKNQRKRKNTQPKSWEFFSFFQRQWSSINTFLYLLTMIIIKCLSF